MELLKVRSGLSPLVSSQGSALQAACMSNLSIAVRIIQRLHAGSLFCLCPSRQAGVAQCAIKCSRMSNSAGWMETGRMLERLAKRLVKIAY